MPEPADKLPDGATLTSSIPVAIPPKQEGLYREVLSILEDRHVPYAVAGAFALQQHTGICRYTKDLDIFLRSEDVAKALGHLREHGFECEICDPVWLAKAHRDEFFVALILFHFVYPAHSDYVPLVLWQDLLARFKNEIKKPDLKAPFRGSLVDEVMFAIDLQEWGLENLLEEYRQRREPKLISFAGKTCG